LSRARIDWSKLVPGISPQSTSRSESDSEGVFAQIFGRGSKVLIIEKQRKMVVIEFPDTTG
jgi:hypothetical protein